MKLYGRVLKLRDPANPNAPLCDRFHPVIESDDGVTPWRGHPQFSVGDARAMLAEAVALIGLCFWPPSYLYDNWRELGVSPWVNAAQHDAFVAGQMLHRLSSEPPSDEFAFTFERLS